MRYPQSYHEACSHLFKYGAEPSNMGRYRIAKALRDLRRMFGREFARVERRYLERIAGCFPTKNR